MPNPTWLQRSIGQIALSGTQLGQTFVNVFHFQAKDTVDAGFTTDALAKQAFDAFATNFLTVVQSTYCSIHPADWTLNLMRAQILERPTQWRRRLTPTETNITSSNAGNAGAGPAETTSPAGVVRWRTALAGKRYRGRSYIGPVPQTWGVDGRLSSAGVTAYTNWINSMNDFWEGATPGAGWDQTVYSRPYNTGEYQYTVRDSSGLHVVTPPEYPGHAENVLAAAIDPILRSQRRREIGVGV